jgi:predicted phosphodiesterase
MGNGSRNTVKSERKGTHMMICTHCKKECASDQFSSNGRGGKRKVCRTCDADRKRAASEAQLVPDETWELAGSGRASVSKAGDVSHSYTLQKKCPSVIERIEQWSHSVFSGQVTTLPPPKPNNVKRYVNLVLSDLHFGSDIDGKHTGGPSYGTVEEARRFALVIRDACEYKRDHRAETSLHVMLLGDIIQNQLHDKRDGDLLAIQATRAIHLLVQGLALLSEAYPQVQVTCLTGNHGRFTEIHKSRAVLHKFNSLETVIYYACKAALSHVKNISFTIPESPYTSISQFQSRIFATHGDTVLTPGNPGKVIKIEKLEQEINSINAALPDSQEYKIFITGHVHTASLTYLLNGAIMMTNGCLVPQDEFAVSIGLLEQQCGQWLFETTEKYPVGDVRLLKIPRTTDGDASLDKLITPWQGLDA